MINSFYNQQFVLVGSTFTSDFANKLVKLPSVVKHLPDDGFVSNATQVTQQLLQAKQTCQRQGIRFTLLRAQVYQVILESPQPIGAYEILSKLEAMQHKTIAPPTVYRSLEFLLNHGFIHQLNSSKAFFACSQPSDRHVAAFLICQYCGDVQEFSHQPIQTMLAQVEQSSKFTIQSSIIELSGVCERCHG